MNVRRIFRLVAAFALVAAVLILARPAWVVAAGAWTAWKERPDPIVPSDDEFAAIVRAVIEANQSKYGLPSPPPPPPAPGDSPRTLEQPKPVELVLEDRSLTLCADEHPSATDECRPGTEYGVLQRVVSRKWNDELKLANRLSVPVPDPGMPTVHRTPEAVVRDLFNTGSWREIYARFPDTAGILEVSVPVLSADRSQALIYVEQHCGVMCAAGTLHVMQRTPDGWRQVRKLRVMDA